MLTARRANGLPAALLALVLGAGCGLLAIANIERLGPLAGPGFSVATTLPIAAYLAGAVALVAAVFVGRHAWAGVALFFLWLPFEDLVRKYAGNDLRVYFLKDLFFVLAMVGLAPRLIGSGLWRKTIGEAWMPLVAVIAVALLLSIPSALSNPSVPILGLKLRFGYLPLVAVGAYLASDAARLRRTLTWLAALSSIVCVIGLLQVVLGPEFLAPTRETPGLRLLVIRESTAGQVIRPNGPFVDPGRFASMTVIALTLGLALVRVAIARRERLIGTVTSGLAIAAAFASGGRTQLVLALVILVVGMMFSSDRTLGRRRTVLTLGVIAAVGASFFALRAAAPEQTSSRLRYYGDTLSPTASTGEVRGRSNYYTREAIGGIRAGGLLGRGTGTAAIGRQYYTTGDASRGEGESGWGAIARETGLVGLVIWVYWVGAWTRRAVLGARLARRTHLSRAGVPLAVFVALNLVVAFTFGIQTFENYLTNAFVWLFSGMVFAAIGLAKADDEAQEAASPYGLPAAS